MRHLLYALALTSSPSLAQTAPTVAHLEEAMGRHLVARYGPTPGKFIGPTGETWANEFKYRQVKAVRDSAALIASRPPAPDACTYRIIAASNYPVEQVRIAASCISGSSSGYTEGWNAAIDAVQGLRK